MKKYVRLLMGLLIAGWWSASCSSDHDDIPSDVSGKGGVRIGLSTDTGFSSRAVDESYYANKNNYTIQILKNGKVVEGCEYKYSELPNDLIELDNGSYVLRAFCGTDVAYSRTEMYVMGEKSFHVEEDQQEVLVDCKPKVAKLVVAFDAEAMKKYFSQYSVAFSGLESLQGASLNWLYNDIAPWYVRVKEEGEKVIATFSLVDTNGKVASVEPKSYSLKPQQSLTLKIAPYDQSAEPGSLGITITINETTIDKPVDILIPSEWAN